MVTIVMRSRFSAAERRAVRAAERRAAELVSAFYVLSPREWSRMPFEVRTAQQLTPDELEVAALAEVRCYGVRRTVGERVLAEHDLYRICLNDERILAHAGHRDRASVEALLLYVLTHELVHVVRFGQRLQTIDLPRALRDAEEASVDRTARLILSRADEPGLRGALDRFPTPDA